MSLSDMQVFTEYAKTTLTETIAQEVQKFNAASNGAIVLRSSAHDGDYSDLSLYGAISGLVRRRNAYGSGAVGAVNLTQLLDTSVKVAAGTPPVNIDPGMFKWIQKSPEEAGVVIGAQLAEGQLQDMLNTGLLALRSATGAIAGIVHDVSAGGSPTASLTHLNGAAAKFGDASQKLVAWVMHSKPMFDIYATALANAERLFQFGNVRVIEDGFGRPLIVTDSPALLSTTYRTFGLVSGGLMVDQNNDFTSNVETTNGDENIQRTYQAEWSYNVGLRGFKWDKANGGASPNDTALGTATNWDRYATSDKDLAGVQLITT